ncbi:MAG: acetyl-CoA carboxylase carboxyltransferase subunit [Deltaproteobacteria bacterium HGW-Deltaproteobacteria-14]|jgi:acetyl-CoA carboxylase carboxyltransferase component|nr:MAG: acetyl-CoA carboxylase carboxyltransferase subunit [Deltaproteobacteria bacterium HGW-Deltaproteobacteria-14]
MRTLPTAVKPRSDTFRANRVAMEEALAKLGAALAAARDGGGEKYTTRHVARGKLLPRERVELLLDRDGYFLELLPLAGHGIRGVGSGAGVIGGIGLVSGVECLITANEATLKGGAVNEWALKKSLRLADIAEKNGLPSIALTESAGADLPNQAQIFVPGGQTFRDLTRRSRLGLPSICCVFGNATAGGAYIPGMSDYTIMVDGGAKVFLAGPPLVKMATGEETDDESLGGAAMHARVSGVADYLARDEVEAIRLARQIVAHLHWRKPGGPDLATIEPPHHDPDELLGLVPTDLKVPFDQREVIARVVDGSRFAEFKREYGPTLVCGWAHIHGYLVGVLANNGILFSESANKGAQFIQLCNQQGTPIVFLQNITGFMVGRQYEEGGIIKNGAKLINAVSNSAVPLFTVMTGASYGAGNYGMAGRAFDPRFLFTWPNHRIAVMGGPQLAGVLDIIKRDSAARRGEEVDEKGLALAKGMITAQIDRESEAMFATARTWDDGIIDPRDTRSVLGIALSAAHNTPVTPSNAWGVFRH